MPYNYQRDSYGSDDYYGNMREDARDRLLDTIARSGRALGGVYGAQLEGNRLAGLQQARTGAPGAMLGGAAMGGMIGNAPGAAIGAGLGAASGLKGSYDANRQLGKGRFQSALGAIGDVLNPGNMLKSPMAMPAAMQGKAMMPNNANMSSYLYAGTRPSAGGGETAVFESDDPFTFEEAQDFAAQGNAESYTGYEYDPVTGKPKR